MLARCGRSTIAGASGGVDLLCIVVESTLTRAPRAHLKTSSKGDSAQLPSSMLQSHTLHNPLFNK